MNSENNKEKKSRGYWTEEKLQEESNKYLRILLLSG